MVDCNIFTFLFSENATRFCHPNGNWDNISNYEQCLHLPEPTNNITTVDPFVELPTIIYYTGYTISLISLTMAIYVFVNFK